MTLVKFQPFPTTKATPFGLCNNLLDLNIADFLGHDSGVNYQPSVNVVETDAAFELEIAVRGFDISNISASVENDQFYLER